ncbi:hypothetical protein [Streptomyces scabiei]
MSHQGEYRAMFVARKETGHYPYFEEVGHGRGRRPTRCCGTRNCSTS